MSQGSVTGHTKARFPLGRLAVLLTILLLLTLSGCNASNAPQPQQATGGGVPDYEIPTLDGGKIRMSQYRGQVVVLDFWAPWCGPCRIQTPHLKKIADDYKDKGVAVIGLSIPHPSTAPGSVEEYAREFDINYTIGFAPEGMFEKYSPTETAIPQTFVFGRDGRKVLHEVGFHPILSGEKLLRAVDTAAQGGQPAKF